MGEGPAADRGRILTAEWTAESEELAPPRELERRVILQNAAAEIDAMYGEADRFA